MNSGREVTQQSLRQTPARAGVFHSCGRIVVESVKCQERQIDEMLMAKWHCKVFDIADRGEVVSWLCCLSARESNSGKLVMDDVVC